MRNVLVEAKAEVPHGFCGWDMGKTSIYQAVTELIDPTVKENNIELVDVEYKKAGKAWTLSSRSARYNSIRGNQLARRKPQAFLNNKQKLSQQHPN